MPARTPGGVNPGLGRQEFVAAVQQALGGAASAGLPESELEAVWAELQEGAGVDRKELGGLMRALSGGRHNVGSGSPSRGAVLGPISSPLRPLPTPDNLGPVLPSPLPVHRDNRTETPAAALSAASLPGTTPSPSILRLPPAPQTPPQGVVAPMLPAGGSDCGGQLVDGQGLSSTEAWAVKQLSGVAADRKLWGGPGGARRGVERLRLATNALAMHEGSRQGLCMDWTGWIGQTALMALAAQGHVEGMLFLLQHGADRTVQNLQGRDALMLAAGNGHAAAVVALTDRLPAEELRQLLSAVGRNDRAAMEAALHNRHYVCAELLAGVGAVLSPLLAQPELARWGREAASEQCWRLVEVIGQAMSGDERLGGGSGRHGYEGEGQPAAAAAGRTAAQQAFKARWMNQYRETTRY